MRAEITDQQIVEEILQGQKDAFEILIRRYNQRLYRIIRIYIRDEDEIEDLIQETYLSCYENLAGFNRRAAFSTWLTRIAINKALLHLRERKKKLSILDSLKELFSDMEKNHNSVNPEEKMISQETKIQLEKLVDRLPDKYREVFMMSQIVQMKSVDIASCLDISEENVRVRLLRAKRILKDRLEPALAQNALFEFGNERCDLLTFQVMEMISRVTSF